MVKKWFEGKATESIEKNIFFKLMTNKISYSVIRSQFSYCPIIWISYPRQTNKMIEKLHVKGTLELYQMIKLVF